MSEPKRAPANVAIARRIGTAIITGTLAPDSFLPSELDLTRQHKVSRSVIREAIRMLASKRLIVSRQKAGTRVRPRGDWNMLDPDLLEWMFDGNPAGDRANAEKLIEQAGRDTEALLR